MTDANRNESKRKSTIRRQSQLGTKIEAQIPEINPEPTGEQNELDNKVKREKERENIKNPEIIAKLTIDKIISLSFTQIYNTVIDKKIGEHCFNFIKFSINPLLSQEYISREIESEETNMDENNERAFPLFYNTQTIDKLNTWEEIIEPSGQERDRSAATQIKTVAYHCEETEKKEGRREETMPIIETEDFGEKNESDIKNKNVLKVSKISVKEKVLDPKEDKDKELLVKKEKVRLEREKKKEQKKKNDKKNIKEEKEDEDSKTEHSIPLIDLPSYDLPESKYLNTILTESQKAELEELRREREIEIKRREEEKKIAEEKAKKEKAAALALKHTKDFDPKTYTFDPNGKIIQKKPQPLSIFAREFWWSKLSIRDGITKRNSLFFPKGPAEKNILNKPLKKDKNTLNPLSSSSKIETTPTLNLPPKKVKFTNIEPENKSESEVIYNPDIIEYNKERKKRDRFSYIPSGENFSLFVPEIGVRLISSEKKTKEGGMNFSMKFNKPSMNEFSRLAIESKNFNSQRYASSNNPQEYSGNNTEPNYMGYAQQFNKETNPLIEGNYILTESTNNNNNLPYLPSNITSKHYQSFKLSNSIQLKGEDSTKMRLALWDDEKDKKYLNFSQSMNSNYLPTTNLKEARNVFRKEFPLLKPIKENTTGREMDRFNSEILKESSWGDNNDYLNKPIQRKSFKKPTKRTNIQEMGFKIAMTKMPRNRNKEKEAAKYHSVNPGSWLN